MSASRIHREARTVAAMVRIYCRGGRHAAAGAELCPECRELLDYAEMRLARCPFQEGKTVCASCRVHCYHAEMRQRIREVMRYAGPRMIARHPVLALRHLLDKRRKEPLREK